MPTVAELPPAFFALTAFVFGLMVGSFLNVVIYRVPRGESIVYPGSHCGACGKPVKAYDNIPLLSYALLRGRCRACKAKISVIYPAVELMTGLLFLAVMFKSGPTWTVITEMAFVAVIVSLIFIDARHKLLPDVITYPAFVLALVAVTALTVLEQPQYTFYAPIKDTASFMEIMHQSRSISWQAIWLGALLIACAAPIFLVIDRMDEVLFGKYFEWAEDEKAQSVFEETEAERKAQKRHDRVVYGTMAMGVLLAIAWTIIGYLSSDQDPLAYQNAYSALLRACLGALVGGGIVWLLRALYFYTRGAEGMGLGDVKMMAVVGAFLGWQPAILVLILGSFLGSAVGLVMARRSKDGLKTALPFGIFLGIASLVALFAGTPILDWYKGMMR